MVKRNLKGKDLEEYKKTISLTDVQREILVGSLLGDASMSLKNGKPHYSVKFEQGEAHAEYVDHLYEIFEPFTGSPPTFRWIDKEKTRRARWFRTYSHKQLIYYWNLFYTVKERSEFKYKGVPSNINKLLTSRGVAYWFMDDGGLDSDKKAFYLNTHNFTQDESNKLLKVLKENFNVSGKIQKDKAFFRIYIKVESAQDFKNLVKPYIVPCFEYKLQLA